MSKLNKDDLINALSVLKTMLKYAKLQGGYEVAESMLADLVKSDVTITDAAEPIKFNRSFETLYAISMNMADECIGNKTIDARFSKLEEEYQELIAEFGKKQFTSISNGERLYQHERITSELSDVLFVLLHIGHKLDISATELLHMAALKMLKRMNDPNYKAKN